MSKGETRQPQKYMNTKKPAPTHGFLRYLHEPTKKYLEEWFDVPAHIHHVAHRMANPPLDRPQSKHEFQQLLQSLVDGSIEAVEHRRLADLLDNDPAARRYFIDYMQLHASLQWDSVELLGAMQVDAHIALTPKPAHASRTWVRPIAALITAVTLILAVGPKWVFVRDKLTPEDPSQVASGGADVKRPIGPESAWNGYVGVIRYVAQPKWQDNSLPAVVGKPIRGGRLHLLSGTVQVETFSGVVLTLRGPCEFRFESATEGFLVDGKLLIDVLQDNARLTVRTPAGELLHMGTEFGVQVNSAGTTKMYVYEGLVELRRHAGNSSRLAQSGVAWRIDSSGRVNGLSRDASAAFMKSMSLPKRSATWKPRPLTLHDRGFRVRYVQSASEPIKSLDAADNLLAGRIDASQDVVSVSIPYIDFEDSHHNLAYENVFDRDSIYPRGQDFLVENGPKEQQTDRNNFVVHVTASFVVHDAWEYSFLVNGDDGLRLRIDGRDVIIDDGIHPPAISIATLMLSPGTHRLELVHYEDGGFARVELGVAFGRTKHVKEFSLFERN